MALTNTDLPGGPTDTTGNTYTQIGPPGGFVAQGSGAGAGSFNGQKWWIAYNIAAGANTVTVSPDEGTTNIHIWEISGLAASRAFDKYAFAFQQSTTSLDTGATATTTYANELLLCVASDDANDTYTLGTNFTNLTTQSNTSFSSASEERIERYRCLSWSNDNWVC